MNAKVIFDITDQEEIERAEELGIEKPESKDYISNVYFRLDMIDLAYIHHEGEHIIISISGEKWSLVYNEELWNKIKVYLESK